MTRFLLSLFLLAATLEAAVPRDTPPAQLRDHYDVIIAGAGTGGFGVAVGAARLGSTVLLLEETDWIGGQMNAAAVTSMDEGVFLVRERGLYHEFFDAVTAHYQALGLSAETAYGKRHLCMEPRVGQDILYAMLGDARTHTAALDVCLRATVTKIQKQGATVRGVEVLVGPPGAQQTRALSSKVLVDATEWGDLLPLTGERYRVGNCTSDAIVPERPIQDLTWTAVVKTYPASVPAELHLATPPPGYEAELPHFTKSLTADEGTSPGNERPWSWGRFVGYRAMPNSEQPKNRATLTRTHLNFNNDFPVTIADVEDPAHRRTTEDAAIVRTLQLVYYIQHDLGKTDWAMANDEGFDTPYQREQIDRLIKLQPALEPFRASLYHFSIIAYARESRRMLGLHTLTAKEIERVGGHHPVQFPNAVALGDYAVDLHGSMKADLLEKGLDSGEDIPTKFGQRGLGPFSIPFESFIPEKLDGFLPAEKNFSQSRLANGATRLQPSTMLMGQAVGVTAALSIRYGLVPRALDPVLVQRELLAAGDTLYITPLIDVAKNGWEWPGIQLVLTRGLMQAEAGAFRPGDPLTVGDLRRLLGGLPHASELLNTPAPDDAQPVPLARFLAALASAIAPAGKPFSFTPKGPPPETVRVSRAEAAALVAQGLEYRALAALGKEGDYHFALPSNRALTPIDPLRNDPAQARWLAILIAHKIIDQPEYWAKHAVDGALCDGQMVADMLRKAVELRRPGTPPDQVFQVAVEERFCSSSEYWSKHAIKGGECGGQFVATILRNIAEVLGSP